MYISKNHLMQYVTISMLEVLNNVTKYLCLKCLKQYNKMTGETISQKIEANILSIVIWECHKVSFTLLNYQMKLKRSFKLL